MAIYVVKDTSTNQAALVRANSAGQALQYILRNRFTSAKATADDVASLMGIGCTVQEASVQVGNVTIPTPPANNELAQPGEVNTPLVSGQSEPTVVHGYEGAEVPVYATPAESAAPEDLPFDPNTEAA